MEEKNTKTYRRFNCEIIVDSEMVNSKQVEVIFTTSTKEFRKIIIPLSEFKIIKDNELYGRAIKSKSKTGNNYYISDEWFLMLSIEIQLFLNKFLY
jgi:hypothetical protein